MNKVKTFGWEYIECPNCHEKQNIPPNCYEAICQCGYKYIGRGKWITTGEQIKDFPSSYNPKELEEYAKIKLEQKLAEIIKEIHDWLDFHQAKQATFKTDELIKHLMKKFL